MKFKDYIILTDDELENQQFRQLNFKLVTESTSYQKIVEDISTRYNLSEDLIALRELLNKDLKRVYRGKYRFDFCIDEGIKSDALRSKKDADVIIKEKEFSFNAKLAMLKQEFLKNKK